MRMGRSTRRMEREGTSIPGTAHFFHAGAHVTEDVLVVDVSLQGAGVLLSNELLVGQMVQVKFAMPRELRCYNVSARIYEIWGVVRFIVSVPPTVMEAHPELDLTYRYEIGLAFCGKQPPPQYFTNPETLFDIKPVPRRDGLWSLRTAPRVPDW